MTDRPCNEARQTRRDAKLDRVARHRANPRRRPLGVRNGLIPTSRSGGHALLARAVPAFAGVERVAVQWPFDGEDIYA
jgi:hypothetical protein